MIAAGNAGGLAAGVLAGVREMQNTGGKDRRRYPYHV
jgi:hypothetical protein